MNKMMKTIAAAVFGTFAVAALADGEAAAKTEIFKDDFKDHAYFAKNWDFRAPTSPVDGVLALDKNHYQPVLKTVSLADAPDATVEVEVAPQSDKGFAGLNIDGLPFFARRNTAVVVWHNAEKGWNDSRMLKLDGYKTGDFVKLSIQRVKTADGVDYNYFANGKKVCTLKNPAKKYTGKVSLTKSQTDAKFKNFVIYANK